MNILFPSAFQRPRVEKGPQLEPKRQQNQLSSLRSPLSQDTLQLSPRAKAKSASPVRFAGKQEDLAKLNDSALVEKFKPAFQSVFQQAWQMATELGASQITAEHVILATIDTLDNVANWQMPSTRSSRSKMDQRQEQMRWLADVLLPNSEYEPAQVLELFRPLAEQLREPLGMSTSGRSNRNLSLQPDLRQAMVEALAQEEQEPVKSLVEKVLWASPVLPAFQTVAESAQRIRASLSDSKSEESSDTSVAMDVSSPIAMTLGEEISQKSPVLAKWLQEATGKPIDREVFGDEFKLPTTPQLLNKGIEMALQEVNNMQQDRGRKQRQGRSPQNNQNKNKELLYGLLPELKNKKTEEAISQANRVLRNAQNKLRPLLKPGDPGLQVEASEYNRGLLNHFIKDETRVNFSVEAFMPFLEEDALNSLGAPASHRAVGKILVDLKEDLNDKRREYLEQFEKTCPTLVKHSENLVRQGMKGLLPEVLMRREGTDSMLAIINSGSKRTSILLNGGSGEGKTYSVLNLAQRFANNDVPKNLQGMQMVALDLGNFVADTGFHGDIEKKTGDMFAELNKYLTEFPDRKVVIFIDEMHRLGVGEGADLLEAMKSSGILEKQGITFIGATTPEDWQKSPLRHNKAFEGRVRELALPAFSQNEKLVMLARQAQKLSEKTGVDIPVELVEQVLTQSNARWPDKGLRPAGDLLELAASLAQGKPIEMSVLEDRLQCKELWLEALKAQKTLKGRFMRQLANTGEESTALKSQLDLLKKATSDSEKGSVQMKDKHLRQAISILTGERIGILSRDELAKLRDAKTVLSQYIVGQPEALERIGSALREIAVRQKTGAVKNRPIVSMLLPGPTGVGKTEVAKAIAKEFMNNNIIRLDMSDFMEKHDISRLTGAPPGYVGYDNGGLVDEVRKNPQSVIVFDEIEKAHPDIFNVLLQILEEGELRDNQSQPVNFRNAIVVLTSNLNNEEITKAMQQHQQQMAQGGRGIDKQLATKALETQVKQLLTADSASGRKGFRPEHLGRLDYVIPFAPLTIGSVSDILDIRVREMNQEPCLKDNNLTVQLSDDARNRLIELTAASGSPSHQEANSVSRKDLLNRPLQSGARDVRSNFEQLISRKVFDALTFELDEIENANLVVDYDPERQDFTVKSVPLEDLDL